jgi:hypothetical protein
MFATVANHPHPTTNSACGGGLTCLVGLENGRVLLLALPSSATVAAATGEENGENDWNSGSGSDLGGLSSSVDDRLDAAM